MSLMNNIIYINYFREECLFTAIHFIHFCKGDFIRTWTVYLHYEIKFN